MSAIVGFVSLDGRPVAPSTAARMLDALAHRGTDAADAWHTDAVALGARFDRMTPERLHAAPVTSSPDGRYTVVADARLDDRDALARAVGVSPEHSDHALVAFALGKWGRDAPARLTGDFAFAAWDTAEQQLFCARDRMGVRPFYYAHLPGRWFAFASEQRAIVDLPGFEKRLDLDHLADYLLVTLDHTSTFYRDLRRLPAATSLSIGPSGLRQHPPYWHLDPEYELRLPSDADYADAFRDVFERAVRDRLRSCHPVGAALSGGLDSSAIAVVARDAQEAPLPVFSGQFPSMPASVQPLIDERPYVQAVVETGGFDLHALAIDEGGPFADYARVSDHLEDAFRTINLYMHWQMFGAAREAGVRVFLDGLDGDTAVSHGLDRFTDLARQSNWKTFTCEARLLASTPARQRTLAWEYALPVLVRQVRGGRWLRAARGAWHIRADFGLSGRRLAGALRDGLFPAHSSESLRDATLRNAFARPDFIREAGAWERHTQFEREAYGPMPSERAAHIRDLRGPLCPLMLEMEDRAAAAFGIEPRYPFFDVRLMEFCVSLPSDQKLRDGYTRRVLRAGLDGVLPDAVRLRTTKGNLKPAFDLALARSAHDEMAPYLFDTAPAIAAFVDMEAVRDAYGAFTHDPLAHSAVGTQLYALAALERGLKRLGLA